MDPFVNPFRELLKQPSVPLGTWLMSGAESTAEAMGCAGFDWLVVDMEHVPIDYKDAYHILQAIAGTRATPVIRLAWNDVVMVKRALDIGAQTLMFPFVQNAEDAKRAVASTRYPTAMETPAAIAKLEEIAAVDGVDALFMGPGDLSASMGVIGNVADAKVQAALKDAAARAKAVGKPIGIVGPTPEMVGQFIDWGYSYVAIASDMGMMMRQANAMITALKPSLAKAVSSSVY